MDTELIKLVAQLLSTFIAITALIISFRAERRNQKRFERQLELTKLYQYIVNILPTLEPTLNLSWRS